MPEYRYLIIGGGMTADAAVRGIREVDKQGSIGIITDEPHPPYSRPPLSKALWQGAAFESVWRNTPLDKTDVHLSRKATGIDPSRKAVRDDHGTEYSYNKLLLATGARVRRLTPDVEGVIYFRTLDDYRRLKASSNDGTSFAVIGGGFIGSEIAAALAMNGKKVTMIFPEPGIGARVYPAALSSFLNTFYVSKGVEVLANDGAISIEKVSAGYLVRTKSGRAVRADGIVAGIGVRPNIELAQSIGVQAENGIVVNEFLQTSLPDVYAAGDVANFFSPALGARMRVEHEDNALTMGASAGKNMAGAALPYHHLPFFYSDLFDLGYEAVGELDARLDVVEDWNVEFREGVVYYLRDNRVRGVLLWNTWGQVDAARSLIAEKGTFTHENLKRRLPV